MGNSKNNKQKKSKVVAHKSFAKMSEKSKNKKKKFGTLQLFQFASKFDIFLMVVGTIGAIIMGTTFPINIATFGDVVDVFVNDKIDRMMNLTRSTPLQTEMLQNVYRFFGVGIGAFISGFFAVSCWQWAAERQISTIRKQFFHSVVRQNIGWFDLHATGEINSRFSEDINKISEGLGDKMANFIQWVTTGFAAYIVAFTSSWKLTLGVIIVSPALIVVGAIVVRVMRKMADEELKAYARAGAIAEQALRGIRTVQAFQGQEKEISKYVENLSSAVKVASKKGLVIGLGNSMLWFVIFLMFAGVIWFGTHLIQAENLPSGKVLPVFLGLLFGSFALGNAFNNLESFSNACAASVNIFEIISSIPEIDSFSEKGLKLEFFNGLIELKKIKFAYPARPDIQIFKDLNIKIEPGQHVALVGSSGCGKSTIVQLLQRFYEPQHGTISVDDYDIKDLNTKWLRSKIGVVSQEPSLFDTTIEENIRFGNMDATEEEIHNAAKKANAHDFIMKLPEGYKTNVGERGAQLSGGQKQRISIARALVRNPKILLLDEATSALDQESEAVVQNALEAASEGRTTITIAHRLSTIQKADKIIAISEGKIIEQGKHSELMLLKGLYYQLVQIQLQVKQESQFASLADNYLSMTINEINETHDVETTKEDELIRSYFDEENLLKWTKGKHHMNKSREKTVKKSFMPKDENNQKKKQNEVVREDDEADCGIIDVVKLNVSEWPLILLGCIGSIIAGAQHPAYAFLSSEFVKLFTILDHYEQWQRVHVLGGIVIGVAVVSAVVRTLQGYCFSKSGAILTARLRQMTFTSIINQDMDFYDMPTNQVGSVVMKLSSDAALVQGATGSKVGQVIEAISNVFCVLLIAFSYGWKLTLVVLLFMPLMIIGGLIQGKAVAGGNNSQMKQMQQAGKIFSEVVDSIRTVVSLGKEEYFMKKCDILIDSTNLSKKNMALTYGFTYAVANSVIFFAYAVSFYYGSVLVNDGEMQYFEVFRVFSAVIFGGMVIGQHSSYGADYTKAKIASKRIIALIKRTPKIDIRSTDGIKLENFTGSLSFVNVSYTYPSRPNTEVLDGLSLVINPGETVALVGASGCGKSTSVQLIERYYDVNNGHLLVDGSDIQILNLKWYRSQLGIVSQEPTLFDCSIAENIAYGDNSRVVPMAEIIQAAKEANIHNFIANLPQGYDTSVGEKGAQLSGGQKQRIAIARALIRNPKILLLDEATSALDSESEKIVQDTIEKASHNRTCITIAHRLSTIQNADRIAVINKGKIVEIGSHEQLMLAKGAYFKLVTAQSGGKK